MVLGLFWHRYVARWVYFIGGPDGVCFFFVLASLLKAWEKTRHGGGMSSRSPSTPLFVNWPFHDFTLGCCRGAHHGRRPRRPRPVHRRQAQRVSATDWKERTT